MTRNPKRAARWRRKRRRKRSRKRRRKRRGRKKKGAKRKVEKEESIAEVTKVMGGRREANMERGNMEVARGAAVKKVAVDIGIKERVNMVKNAESRLYGDEEKGKMEEDRHEFLNLDAGCLT